MATPRIARPAGVNDTGLPAVPISLDQVIAHLAMRPQQAEAFVAGLADALIQAKDAAEPDPDLEDGGEGEPSLGAPEVEFTVRGLPERRGHIDQRHWWDGNAVNDDGEPTLGQPEIGARSYIGRGAWVDGYQRNPDHEECEAVSEDEGACIQALPHDGDDVADVDSDDLGGKPTLGTPENPHDQQRWAQGGLGCQEGDHNTGRDLIGYGAERNASRTAARQEARALIETRVQQPKRPKPGTFTLYPSPRMVNGIPCIGEIHG